ncbi:hypothetical protein [Rhizobium mesoamericanum]|uniref:Uncharacterized protein n=1 Tax=Rhizobium mesoamericanum STM3625 TaxID=1211777 RepID=K0Q4S6_9HYPH|nr:hypothetical protein [Rhizobium mesoamericanum]CCM78034.1 hypothetical protein BN77_1008 [Rhizobium mesoamericanum STM3625]
MADLETNIQTGTDAATRADGLYVVRLSDDALDTGNFDVLLHNGRELAFNIWWVLDHAKETHARWAMDLLKAYIKELIELPKFWANAAKNYTRVGAETLRGFHDFLRADSAPGKASLEIVGQGEFGITLRYNSGRGVRTRGGPVSSFTASAPFFEPLLDINGEGIEFLIQLVKEGVLPKTFTWEETISDRKRGRLVKMLEDALAERRASTRN